jgi:hypothetical protein
VQTHLEFSKRLITLGQGFNDSVMLSQRRLTFRRLPEFQIETLGEIDNAEYNLG